MLRRFAFMTSYFFPRRLLSCVRRQILGIVALALLAAWAVAPGQAEPKSSSWPFVPLTRPEVPLVKDKAWVRNPIDAFVLEKLEKAGLRPNSRADKLTLLRRVTFDLTGLAPTPEECEDFLAGPFARRLSAGRRAAAQLAAVRRALGPALARRRSLRGDGRIQDRPAAARRLPLSRLRDPLVQ